MSTKINDGCLGIIFGSAALAIIIGIGSISANYYSKNQVSIKACQERLYTCEKSLESLTNPNLEQQQQQIEQDGNYQLCNSLLNLFPDERKVLKEVKITYGRDKNKTCSEIFSTYSPSK